jgi:acetolactate synthase small subunit
MSADRQVVYVLEVADRPGIMHSIAAVFAHRGLSIHGMVADTGRKPPRILVVFEGTPRQQALVEQVLARLHHVHQLRTLPANSPQLRAVAICRTLGPLPLLDDVVAQVDDDRALLSGSYVAVDAALDQLLAAGLVSEISRSLVAL